MVRNASALANSAGGGRGKGSAVSVHFTVLLRASSSLPQITFLRCLGTSLILSFISTRLRTVGSPVISTAVALVAAMFVLIFCRRFVTGVSVPVRCGSRRPDVGLPQRRDLSPLHSPELGSIWEQENGTQVFGSRKIIEANVFLVGNTESSCTVELDDTFVMPWLNGGEELGNTGFRQGTLLVEVVRRTRLFEWSWEDHNPLSLSAGDFCLFRNFDRELENVPDVVSLFRVEFGGVMGSENVVEVNGKALNDLEPLTWWDVGTSG